MPGAGGTDSQDWGGYAGTHVPPLGPKDADIKLIFSTELKAKKPVSRAVTIAVTGPLAYGYLRPEKGVHRLGAALPPLMPPTAGTLHSPWWKCLPEMNDSDEINVPAEDIKVDVYKSSGAGGQNVQKNATAVRLTHIPTGLVVTCQNERSQVQNRENALRVLKARLLEIKQEAQEEKLSELRGEYTKAEWGSQIRSYVLHPYQLVKDHRTDFEMGDTSSVLDGEIDPLYRGLPSQSGLISIQNPCSLTKSIEISFLWDTTSSRGTAVTWLWFNPIKTPNSPRSMASIAPSPNLLARMRS